MKQTYRTYDDLRAFLTNLSADYNSDGDATAYGFALYLSQHLVDNGYQIEYYEQEEPQEEDVLEDWRKEWLGRELGELAMKTNALNDTAKISGFSSKRTKE